MSPISLTDLNINDYSTDLQNLVESLLKAESADDCRHHAENLARTLDKAGVRHIE